MLALVRLNQYPLDALPIAEITRQYLACIEDASEADVEFGADFFETASWLGQLKSRALLLQAPDAIFSRDVERIVCYAAFHFFKVAIIERRASISDCGAAGSNRTYWSITYKGRAKQRYCAQAARLIAITANGTRQNAQLRRLVDEFGGVGRLRRPLRRAGGLDELGFSLGI